MSGISRRRWLRIVAAFVALCSTATADGASRRLLYVAAPGVRNYVEYGGVGVLVFDVDAGHRFVKRIPTWDVPAGTAPENVKGIAASAETGKLYLSTPQRLACFDLVTEAKEWERVYDGGCDRMALSPDGRTLYVPSFEGPTWHVVDAATGDLTATLRPDSGAHNTVYGRDGKRVYLAGLRSPLLSVAETATHSLERTVGPFGSAIRPFTVNAAGTRCYVCVNDLLGFEVGDLTAGNRLHRVEVAGFDKGPVARHGCPSHGIGLTPDETELWVCDAHNRRLHVFDATADPPKQTTSLAVRDEPGWITFTIDGQYAYPSSGEVIEVATKRAVAVLKDEEGRHVGSEKLLEIDFAGGKPVRAGDQFGLGRKR